MYSHSNARRMKGKKTGDKNEAEISLVHCWYQRCSVGFSISQKFKVEGSEWSQNLVEVLRKSRALCQHTRKEARLITLGVVYDNSLELRRVYWNISPLVIFNAMHTRRFCAGKRRETRSSIYCVALHEKLNLHVTWSRKKNPQSQSQFRFAVA